MLSQSDYSQLDARSLVDAVRAGRLRPTEIAAVALQRAETINQTLHAFTYIAYEQAMEAARGLEQGLAEGRLAGPLAGVPVAIKDLVLTRDMPTTFGSPIYQTFLPEADDIVVERLRAAGAILIGKTNVSEFGFGGVGHNPLFQTTRNPWNPELTSGGSSAGSAVAVATGVCPVAIGSDGGGSIRLPAAFNGLFGIKASMGRVPLWPGCRDEDLPGVSGWETIEHIGPLTRTVEDAALVLSVIAGPDPRDRHSIPCADIDWPATVRPARRAWRIAYCADWGGEPLDPDVRRICEEALSDFAAHTGSSVEHVSPPFPFNIEMFRGIVAADTDIAGLRALAEQSAYPISANLAAFLNRAWTADEFVAANIDRKAAVNAMARLMSSYDLFVTPTVSCLPFAIDRDGPGEIDGRAIDNDAWTPAAFPSNLTGQPAASVPAGWTSNGLPVGLQFMGRHLADADVLGACADFEFIRPWAGKLGAVAHHPF